MQTAIFRQEVDVVMRKVNILDVLLELGSLSQQCCSAPQWWEAATAEAPRRARPASAQWKPE